MLVIDEPTIALPLVTGHDADHHRVRSGNASKPQQATWLGTSVYRCFRYERAVDPAPVYANGVTVPHLPADPREWRVRPWREYEATALYESQAATAWFGRQLRDAAARSGGISAAAESWIGAVASECAAALGTLVSAYQTAVDLPGGNLLAVAVVGMWDSSEVHPLLRGLAATSEVAGP